MAARKLSDIGEFGYLQSLLPRLFSPASLRKRMVIGPGDDAAALRWPAGRLLVATTDTLVEGTHFERRWLSPFDLGYKVLAVNLSDLAAMGDVIPMGALITAGLPGDTPVDSVDKLYRGLENCARQWKTGFLGGDTVGSKRWLLSVTLLGAARSGHLICRSGARPGDLLLSIGAQGEAKAGLEILQSGRRIQPWMRPLVAAFRRPQPRLREGALLGRNLWASSLLDSSDGLKASVRLIAEASGTGARLNLQQVPVSAVLSRWAHEHRRPVEDYVLNGGEDYSLVLTASRPKAARIQKSLGAAVIGEILPRSRGVWAENAGKKIFLNDYGYKHFH